ncbi:MAG: RHS repeat-associated core domain-containing protein [bacterium]
MALRLKQGVWHGGGPWGPVRRIKTMDYTVTTDEAGRFEFPIETAGIYSLDFTKEGYSEAQRRADLIKGEWTAVDPVFITPVEALGQIDGNSGGIVENEAGTISVELEVGQLPDEVVTVSLAEYRANRDLPGALPENTLYTYAMSLEAYGTSTKSKTASGKPRVRKLTAVDIPKGFILRVENTLGLPVGFTVPVGTWNPRTLQWDTRYAEGGKPVYGIVVEDSGKWKGSSPKGTNRTYIAFPLPPGVHDCNVPVQPPPKAGQPEIERSQGGYDGSGRKTGPGGQRICNSPPKGLQAGNLLHIYEMPSIQSFGREHAIRLIYDSHTVNPYVTVSVPVALDSSRQAIPDTVALDLRFAGESYHPVRFTPPTEDSLLRVSFPMLRTGMPSTGVYGLQTKVAYEYRVQYYRAVNNEFGNDVDLSEPSGVFAPDPREFTTEMTRSFVVENRIGSPFGAGWRIEDLDRIVRTPEGHALMIGGDVPQLFGYDAAAGSFTSPDADFASLEALPNGRYRLVLPQGTERIYNEAGWLVSIREPNEIVTKIAYDERGLPVKFTYPGEFESVITYTQNSFRIRDAVGRTIGGTIDANGDLIAVAGADGVTTFEYTSTEQSGEHPPHLLVGHTKPYGGRRAWTLDYAGRVVGEVNGLGDPERIEPEDSVGDAWTRPLGVLPQQKLPQAVTRLQVFDWPLPKQLFDPVPVEDSKAQVWDRRGNVTIYQWESVQNKDNWVAFTITDALGRTTQSIRDEKDLVRRVIRPNGSAISMEYDDRGNMISLRSEDLDATTTYTYDTQWSKISSVTDPQGSTTTFTYDGNGNIETVTDALGNRTTYTYNSSGLPILVTDAMGQQTRFEYDSIGRLSGIVSPSGTREEIQHDEAGNVTRRVDALGRATTLHYDEMSRLVRIINPSGNSTEYEYAAAECGCAAAPGITCVTDARGNATRFIYDDADRLAKIIDPLGQEELYTYDANGNLRSKTNRNGETIAYEYDEADRLIGKHLPGGDTVIYRYDVNDNLVFAKNQDCEVGFEYDRADRAVAEWQQWDEILPNAGKIPIRYTNEVEYDKNGNRVSLTNQDSSVTYRYDELNRLTGIESDSAGAFEFDYDVLSRRSALRYPNGVVTSYGYDEDGQLLHITHQKDSQVLASFKYEYDAAGNRIRQNITRQGGKETLDYEYDSLNQLISESLPAEFVSEPYSTGEIPVSAMYDNLNRLLEDKKNTYEWDANGNLVTQISKIDGLTTRFTYNSENRLVHSAQYASLQSNEPLMEAEYVYDPLGRRSSKKVNGVVERYHYDGLSILSVIGTGGVVTERYLHGLGIDEPLAFSKTGGKLYFMTDVLGSVVLATDLSGAPVAEQKYSAFGQSVDSAPGRYSFTARELDPEISLHYFRAREYVDSIGEFLSVDPIASLQRTVWEYAYARNNPIRYVDPLGLDEWWQKLSNAAQKVLDFGMTLLDTTISTVQGTTLHATSALAQGASSVVGAFAGMGWSAMSGLASLEREQPGTGKDFIRGLQYFRKLHELNKEGRTVWDEYMEELEGTRSDLCK